MVVLEADVLSVVLEYVDTLDDTLYPSTTTTTEAAATTATKTATKTLTTTAAAAAGGSHDDDVRPDVLVVRGGAECRCVSRSWRASVEDAVGRALPPMPSVSLAALLKPGRLSFVLLSCRYNVDRAYDVLVSRAEAVGVHLRCATEAAVAATAVQGTQEAAVATPLTTAAAASGPVPLAESQSVAPVGAETSSQSSSQELQLPQEEEEEQQQQRFRHHLYRHACYRVALKRIVGEVLDRPAFAWCSTLGPDDSCLLQGCVGAPALLKASWFSE